MFSFGCVWKRLQKRWIPFIIILGFMDCLPIVSHATNLENDFNSSWSPWYNNGSKALKVQGNHLLDNS